MKISVRFREALKQADPLVALRDVAVTLRSEGLDKDTIMDQLESLRMHVTETEEDVILEVMDFLNGWSSSHMKIE